MIKLARHDNNREELGIAGAALIGALAGAAAVFLSNPSNRRKASRTLNDWTEKGGEAVHTIQKTAKREMGMNGRGRGRKGSSRSRSR